jgi:[ribosomal protein S5]-alanine N-acetyltransferase
MFPDRLMTAHLLLRPITWADGPAIFDSYAQDPVVTRFLVWKPHASVDDTYTYIARCTARPADGCAYALLRQADMRLLGAFELRRPTAHRLDFGYVLARDWWGQGLMTETLVGVAGWAMRQNDIWRISGVCDVENVASARVMEKAGFTCEGLLRRWVVHPNISAEPRDCLSFAMVR